MLYTMFLDGKTPYLDKYIKRQYAMKILIVDNSELFRERLINSLLAIKNIEIVDEVQNGIEALQVIKDKFYELVVLDIRMPGKSGITVLKEMKKTGIKSKICIFSNYPYLQYKQKCAEEGADYFFDKSEDFNKIIDLVTNLSLNNIEGRKR